MDEHADYNKIEIKCKCKILLFFTRILKNLYDLNKAPADYNKPYYDKWLDIF